MVYVDRREVKLFETHPPSPVLCVARVIQPDGQRASGQPAIVQLGGCPLLQAVGRLPGLKARLRERLSPLDP